MGLPGPLVSSPAKRTSRGHGWRHRASSADAPQERREADEEDFVCVIWGRRFDGFLPVCFGTALRCGWLFAGLRGAPAAGGEERENRCASSGPPVFFPLKFEDLQAIVKVTNSNPSGMFFCGRELQMITLCNKRMGK